jgi:hypothetical protein
MQLHTSILHRVSDREHKPATTGKVAVESGGWATLSPSALLQMRSASFPRASFGFLSSRRSAPPVLQAEVLPPSATVPAVDLAASRSPAAISPSCAVFSPCYSPNSLLVRPGQTKCRDLTQPEPQSPRWALRCVPRPATSPREDARARGETPGACSPPRDRVLNLLRV